jgi:ABC-2 type transport system permease protein
MPNQLSKYWALLKLSWQSEFAFRASFIIWRLRNFSASLISLTLWSIVFTTKASFLGYSSDQMLTYVFLITILFSVILSTQQHGLAGQVYSGNISYQLIKPFKLFAFLGTQDLADKAKNIFFVILECLILYLLFQPKIIFPGIIALSIFGIWVIAGAILNFLLALIFGAIGFWSPDVWAPKFLFFMLIEYAAGRWFPIDILPKVVQTIFYSTPFPYLSYVQTQIFLEKLNNTQITIFSLIMIGWILLLGLLNHFLWQRGLKDYAAAGH